MDLFTRDHLHELLTHTGPTLISITIPTHRMAPESLQDGIRFKNMLKQVEEQLKQRGVSASESAELLAPVKHLPDEKIFWQHQSDGLAVFLGQGFSRVLRLPCSFPEQVHVLEHFYVNPLLPLLQSNGTFYLLAVSQNSCRLFSGDRDQIQQIQTESLPTNLRDTLGTWQEMELNFHAMKQGGNGASGTDTAMFHGHFEDNTKQQLLAYFRKIDDAVAEILKSAPAPLVFAGVDYLFPIYQQANRYSGLCDQAIPGSPDQASGKQLHKQAWEIVHPQFRQREQKLLDEFRLRLPRETAAAKLSQILVAAEGGLVDTLLLKDNASVRGWYDTETRSVTLSEGTTQEGEDLIDRAVRQTLQASGDVLTLSPEAFDNGAPAYALLRAPVSALAR